MRLWEVLPALVPQVWQRWAELARSVPPHDPLRLLKYPPHIEHAAKAGDAAAVAMLDLLDDMLRALIAAGIDGRVTAEGFNSAEILQLRPSHWLLLNGVAARELRRSIDLGHDRIHLPGESTWDDGASIWDHGETRWDVGIPETDRAVIEGVWISYAAPSAAAGPTPQPAAAPEAAREPPPAAPQQAGDQPTFEQGVELIRELCRTGNISRNATTKEMFRLVVAAHGEDHWLVKVDERQQRRYWAAAKQTDQWPPKKPLQSENS